MRRPAIALALIALAGCASNSALHLAPCTIAGAAARCGTFDVAEAPASSRMLALKVIVLPATERNESAIFGFGGGPGIPVTPVAALEVKFFAPERRLHDTVFVDERGSGGSAPLQCPDAMKKHEQEMIEDDLFAPALVADCRREVETHADPSRYTFDAFVDDIEALRQALHYGPINIVALSAGTRAALTFLARHPQSVRSLLLTGPLPPENIVPSNFSRDAAPVIDRLARDSSSVFPTFATDLSNLLQSLGSHPVDIASGGYMIHMTRGAFMEYLRTNLYTAESQSLVPLIVHLAAQDDWQAIAPRFIAYRKNFYDGLPIFLSITCPTDVRHIEPADENDYRVQRQIAACRQWTPGLAPRITVPRVATPILIFSGEIDPVTPPRWADTLVGETQNARVIRFANTGHTEFNACTDQLEVQFFDAGSFEGLDDSCAKTIRRPPFATTLP